MPIPGIGPTLSVIAQAFDAETIALLFYLAIFFGPPLLFLYAGLPMIWSGIRLRVTDLDTVADATEGGGVELEGTARSAGTVVESTDYGDRLVVESDEDGFMGVPFLLECDDGTVLVRGDRLVDLGKSRFYSGPYLDVGETAYVTGFARDPDAVTDVTVPDHVDAVVAPPETSSPLDRVRRLLSLPFTVVNDSKSSFTYGRVVKGIGVSGLAVAWVVLLFLFAISMGADPGICARETFC